jgi:hypothetical protein
MNHPFSLSTAELAIADLSFGETVEQAAIVGGARPLDVTSASFVEEGGHPGPDSIPYNDLIDLHNLPIRFPTHPPVVIHPQPTPRPRPRPRPGHPRFDFA